MPHITAIIPAAGLGTRLLPFTRYLPKEMMPLGDKPIIYYSIAEIQQAGVEKIILITNTAKQSMADYLLHHSGLNLNEHNLMLVEQNEQKGLGHAVLCALEKIDTTCEQVVIIAPDDVMMPKNPNGVHPPSSLAIKQLLQHSKIDKNAMWVAVEKIKPSLCQKYGILDLVDGIKNDGDNNIYEAKDLVEKPSPDQAPSHIGIIARYVLPMAIFDSLQHTKAGAGGEIQLTDAMKHLLPEKKFYGVETNLIRLDTGNVDGLFQANYFCRYHTMPPDIEK
ncbi:MAG: UTP--glucose-1-phosphate uridylyltransferase [Alphaproteobacteria bacterium]